MVQPKICDNCESGNHKECIAKKKAALLFGWICECYVCKAN